MHLICTLVVFCAFVAVLCRAETPSNRNWDLGNGVKVRLEKNQAIEEKQNATIFETHKLRMDYQGIGISVGKASGREVVEVGVYLNNRSNNDDVKEEEKEEGRGRGDDKDGGHMSLSALMGFKMATIVSVTLGMMGALVFKALGIAKFAFLVSAAMIVAKLLHHHPHHHQEQPTFVEFEHSAEPPPVISGYTGAYHHPSASANYITYAHLLPGGIGGETVGAATALNYHQVDLGGNNITGAASNQQVVAVPAVAITKRRDLARKKMPLFTVHKYTVSS